MIQSKNERDACLATILRTKLTHPARALFLLSSVTGALTKITLPTHSTSPQVSGAGKLRSRLSLIFTWAPTTWRTLRTQKHVRNRKGSLLQVGQNLNLRPLSEIFPEFPNSGGFATVSIKSTTQANFVHRPRHTRAKPLASVTPAASLGRGPCHASHDRFHLWKKTRCRSAECEKSCTAQAPAALRLLLRKLTEGHIPARSGKPARAQKETHAQTKLRHTHTDIHSNREREREREIKTHTHTHTHRHPDTQTHKGTATRAHAHAQTERKRENAREGDAPYRHAHKQRDTETQRDRETETLNNRERDTQRHTHTHTDPDTRRHADTRTQTRTQALYCP